MIERAASGKSPSQSNWRFYYWASVAVLFAFAAWQRFAFPLDPIADSDVWGYLAPALRKLVGGEFGHTYGRNFVYPAFVFSLLRVFQDFRAIVITQHLLGLVAVAIFLVTWRRARVFVPDSRLSLAVHDGLGLLAATILLLAAEPIRAEMQLRPEGVCAFLVSINLYFATQFMACCFVERRPRASVGHGIGTVFTSVLLASAKPSFALMAVIACLPVTILFFRRGWFREKIALAIGAALGAVLLLVPEYFLGRDDELGPPFLPATLFVNHADLIRDQMADDLQCGASVPYSREWLERVHAALRTEIAKSSTARPDHYWSLGFDPDFLMYNPGSIVAQLRREGGYNGPDPSTFYRFYYRRIWQGRPLAVARKIQTQMSIFYSAMCPAYNREKSLALADKYGDGAYALRIEPNPELWMAYAPAVEFVSRTESLARNGPISRQPIPIRMTLSFFAGLYRPLLWIALAVSAVVLFQQRHRRRLGWLTVLVLFLYSHNAAAACLEVAIVNSLEVRRYLAVQMFFTTVAQFLALWLLCEMALTMRARQVS
ncbi:MAG TPA: hypothetical protein VN921_03070 [Chthoniobacterales bacterium]|nr:hypothetical protein [Chthoniobacterales bacterium]